MKTFIHLYPYYRCSLTNVNHDITHNIAKTLIDFGVEEVKISTHFIAGQKDIDHLDLWHTSLECSPYVKVLYKGKEDVLLWAIGRYLGLRFSGGAGDSYMQMSFGEVGENWRLSHLTPKTLNLGVYAYFQAMKDVEQNETLR